MMLERTPDGLEATLKPRGIARFATAGFLSIWLCGWAVGESFAVYAILKGAREIIEGTRAPSDGTVPVGAFLLAWVSFWTLGGIVAMREWLRLVWSEDRILVVPEGLRVERRLGPFRRTTTIGRSELKRIYAKPRRSRLLATTSRRTVEITALATRAECEALERDLSEALDLTGTPEAGASPERPPGGWTDGVDPEGWSIVLQDPAIRRTQAKIAWAFAWLLAIPTILLCSRILDRPQWGALAAMLAIATVMTAWGAWRLSTTHLEWRLDSGKLRLRRRFGWGAADLFEGGSVELVERSDSDGDSWFDLNAVSADGTSRKQIARALGDPLVPRRLGAWISGRASVPFDDRATEARKEQDLAAALAQLEATGRFGQWMSRMLRRS